MVTPDPQDLLLVEEYKAYFKIPRQAVNTAEVDVTAAVIGDMALVNGHRYEAKAATDAPNGEWADADGLALCINEDPDVISGIHPAAFVSGNIVTLRAPSTPFIIEVVNLAGILLLHTEADDFIQQKITAASRMIRDRLCNGRQLVEVEEPVVDYLEAENDTAKRLPLSTRPVSEVVSVFEDNTLAYGASTELVEGTDFIVDSEFGVLHRLTGVWSRIERAVRVTYKGGFLAGAISEAYKEGCAWQANWMIQIGSTQAVTKAESGVAKMARSARLIADGISSITRDVIGMGGN